MRLHLSKHRILLSDGLVYRLVNRLIKVTINTSFDADIAVDIKGYVGTGYG